MKSELLASLLDRPIAFHRALACLTGGINSALMLSQAIYWSRRTKDAEGWFWKTRDEWFEETALTRWEQEAARKQLRKMSFWTEREDRINHRLFYKVNFDGLLRALSTYFAEGGKTSSGEEGNPPNQGEKTSPGEAGNPPPRGMENLLRSNTETTSETTTETTSPDPPLPSKNQELPYQEMKLLAFVETTLREHFGDSKPRWKNLSPDLEEKLINAEKIRGTETIRRCWLNFIVQCPTSKLRDFIYMVSTGNASNRPKVKPEAYTAQPTAETVKTDVQEMIELGAASAARRARLRERAGFRR